MSDGHLVLDNSVLSAFAECNWFCNLSFWNSEYTLITTERVWTDEFTPHHEYAKPDWLSVERVETAQLESKPVELGEADWTLVRLAERVVDPVLVTNDSRLHSETAQREVDEMWGTELLIQTFEACGIGEEGFNQSLPVYTSDVHLPAEVVEELHSTEKD